MNLKIELTSKFKRKAKTLVKKFPSFKQELKDLITALENDPTLGTPVKHNCYKIRIAIKSKGEWQKWRSQGNYAFSCYRHIYLLDLQI